MTAITRQRLEKAFGNYPDIIRAWEQMQSVASGASNASSLAAVTALADQLATAEIAAFLQTKAVLAEAREYAEQVSDANGLAAQVMQLRAEVQQLRELIQTLIEKP